MAQSVVSGLGHLRMCGGAVRRDTVAEAMRTHSIWLARQRLTAQVADYRLTQFDVDPGGLCASVALLNREAVSCLVVPTAIVAAPEQIEMWGRYAGLMQQRGIARAAFTCPERARMWAGEMAALLEAQRQHLARWR